MDADRFDTLTRSVTVAGSRRRALAAALGGLIASFGLAEVEADFPGQCKKNSHCGPGAKCVGSKKRKRGKKGKRGKCRCLEGLTSCPGTKGCIDLQSSNANCGACGNLCRFDTTCQAGRCETGRGCDQGETFCNEIVQCGAVVGNQLDCLCATSLDSGRTACSDLSVTGAGCSACTTDEECTEQLGGTPGLCSPGGPNCANAGCDGTGATPNFCSPIGCLGTTSLSDSDQP